METAAARQRSNWWFLLPIFMGIVGGVIAFFVLRGSDPSKAKNCLFLGIALGVIGIAMGLLFGSFLVAPEVADLSPL